MNQKKQNLCIRLYTTMYQGKRMYSLNDRYFCKYNEVNKRKRKMEVEMKAVRSFNKGVP